MGTKEETTEIYNLNHKTNHPMKHFIYLIILASSLLFTSRTEAQTPTIKWFYDVNDASFGQSAAADIDHDNKLELVFGCYRNDSCVYALNAEDGS